MMSETLCVICNKPHDHRSGDHVCVGNLQDEVERLTAENRRLTMMLDEYVRLDNAGKIPMEPVGGSAPTRQGMKMQITPDWLREKTAEDDEESCEAGSAEPRRDAFTVDHIHIPERCDKDDCAQSGQSRYVRESKLHEAFRKTLKDCDCDE